MARLFLAYSLWVECWAVCCIEPYAGGLCSSSFVLQKSHQPRPCRFTCHLAALFQHGTRVSEACQLQAEAG